MSHFWSGLLTLLTLSACVAPAPLRVLFVSNSHTYVNDVPELVRQIGIAEGVQLEVDSVTAGGATLEDHIQSGAVRQRLERATFSAIVLQGQSGHQVLELNEYEASARKLAELTRAHNARVFIYMGWTRQSVVEQYGYTQQNWTDSALRVARAIVAGVAPVGEAWLYAKRHDPALGLRLQESDGNHATFPGSYAAAATILPRRLPRRRGSRCCGGNAAAPSALIGNSEFDGATGAPIFATGPVHQAEIDERPS